MGVSVFLCERAHIPLRSMESRGRAMLAPTKESLLRKRLGRPYKE